MAAAPDQATLQVFNTISDPYNDASQRSDRDKGLAFIARACRTGKVCICGGVSYWQRAAVAAEQSKRTHKILENAD